MVADKTAETQEADMGLTGVPLMLYNYQAEVAAFLDGELVYEYLKEKIPVSIFNDFDFEKYDMTKFMQYDMVFINTLLLYPFAKELPKRKIPVFWWIHEEEDVYTGLYLEKNEIQESPFLSIYGVGNRDIKAFEEKIGQSIKNMLYGIEEPDEKMQIIPKEKLVSKFEKELLKAVDEVIMSGCKEDECKKCI